MARPIFTDEVFGKNEGSQNPQYDIVSDGEKSMENVELKFKNPITQQGTKHNAATMNSMFNFSNMIAMENSKYATLGLGTSTVTETVRDRTTDNLIANRVSIKKTSTVWEITEKLYADNGFTIKQSRTITYTKTGNEWGAIV